jgi:protease-4
MPEEARHIYERRRLRRRVALWRLVAVVALAATAGVWFWRDAGLGPYIARYSVTGVIFEDPQRDALLRRIAGDDDVRALILRIDSPGGSVPGAEALYDALRAVAAEKPVATVMGEVAASGGYIAALAGDRLFARGGTITGSIGVFADYPDVTQLLEEIGISVERVASSPLKAAPSPYQTAPDEAYAAAADMIEDSYAWFVGLVGERRGLEPDRARALGDGRVYTGRMALENGLIDQIGGETEALEWLRAARGVAADLPVREVEVDALDDDPFCLFFCGGAVERALARWTGGLRLMAILR